MSLTPEVPSDRVRAILTKAEAAHGGRITTSVSPATVILREVAAKHGVSVLDLQGPRRFALIVQARTEAAWRLRTELGLSFPRIGQRLGGRNHAGIIRHVRAYQQEIDISEVPREGR